MAPGWNEVKERAVIFSKEWKDAFNEEATSTTFRHRNKTHRVSFRTIRQIQCRAVCGGKKPKVKKLN
jgi:hypothetical protein